MMRGTAMVVLAAIGWLTALAPSAEAQRRRRDDPQAEARETARTAYAEAQRLFAAGQFAEAEASFRRAYEAVPNAVVLLGLAQAQERQENITGTVETLERYLAERADAPDRQAVSDRVAELRRRPAKLNITTTPAGARVRVDGTAATAPTPVEIEVPPGTHTVRVELEGYTPAEQTVEASFAGRHDVNIPLEAAAPPEELSPIEPNFGPEPEGPAEPEPEDEGGGGPGAGVWVLGVLAGAGLIAGTALGFLALSEQASFDETPTWDTKRRGERLALFADVAFGIAAASMVTAIVLFATSDGGEEPESGSSSDDPLALRLAPTIDPNGAGALVTGTF